MFAHKFAELILALLITFSTSAGNSPYSFETLAECGRDPSRAACDTTPRCATPTDWRCAPPRWSESRGGWVVTESADNAYRRFNRIAQSIARVAMMQTRCRDGRGVVLEDCTPAGWPEGPESLAMAAATTAISESALREDIEHGYPPMGRGPDGEMCLVQIQPFQIIALAPWVTDAQRRAYNAADAKTRKQLEESLAGQVLGDTDDALDKCFALGMRLLARSRGSCQRSGAEWPYAMWSRYGTGSTCAARREAGGKGWAEVRQTMFYRMKSSNAQLTPHVRALLGLDVRATPSPLAAE